MNAALSLRFVGVGGGKLRLLDRLDQRGRVRDPIVPVLLAFLIFVVVHTLLPPVASRRVMGRPRSRVFALGVDFGQLALVRVSFLREEADVVKLRLAAFAKEFRLFPAVFGNDIGLIVQLERLAGVEKFGPCRLAGLASVW